jgi:hypothetical protein
MQYINLDAGQPASSVTHFLLAQTNKEYAKNAAVFLFYFYSDLLLIMVRRFYNLHHKNKKTRICD